MFCFTYGLLTVPDVQTYILKLARSGEDGEKVLLLLESGSRFHTTQVGLAEPSSTRARWHSTEPVHDAATCYVHSYAPYR